MRYQGAIIENHHLLLLKHAAQGGGRSYWAIPGGGLDDDETEEQCVAREMKEETHLVVSVGCLLLDESDLDGIYKRRKTYLYKRLTGEAQPGFEPELEGDPHLTTTDVRWFDLRADSEWDEQMKNDKITCPQVQQIRAVLGYENTKV